MLCIGFLVFFKYGFLFNILLIWLIDVFDIVNIKNIWLSINKLNNIWLIYVIVLVNCFFVKLLIFIIWELNYLISMKFNLIENCIKGLFNVMIFLVLIDIFFIFFVVLLNWLVL